MPPDENNSGPLGLSNAVEAMLAVVPSPRNPEPPKKRKTNLQEEVTESEGSVKAEEAAVRDSQRPTVDPDEEQLRAEGESTEIEEDEPDGDDAEVDEDELEGDEDSGDADDDEDADDSEPETVFELDDGTKVDLDELKRGYLRQSDYTKKTQEVAEARKHLQQAYQARQQERQTLAENLNLALGVVEPQLAELARTDWDRLATEDPYSYAEKRALFDQASVRYNKLVQQAQSVVQKQQQETQQQLQQRVQQENQRLRMAIPDFADPKRSRALKGAIIEYAISGMGLSEQEAKGITDHRMIVLLNKARQFDALQRGDLSAARKKVSKTPKKALQAGSPKTKSERQQRARADQMSKLRQTGKLDDAVELLMGR